MSDDDTDSRHPVVAGLVALVGVAVVVGLLISGGALAASSVLGLDDSSSDSTTTSEESMYLPKPSDTVSPTAPLVTLAPGETTAPPSVTPSATPTDPITLSSAQTEVAPMEQIQFTGTYPGGEGKVVQVQRFEDGQWVDFSTVDAVVSGGTFSTYVLTARTGKNKFRVRDTDSEDVSNEVEVQVG